jgi:hypothetical protein
MIRPWAVVGLVFLLVPGCAQFDFPGPNPEEVQASIESDSTVPIDLSEGKAMEDAITWQIPTPPPPRRKPDSVMKSQAVEEADPDMLIGLNFHVTRALLGEPSLQTDVSPAKIWTYNGQKCMLNVFFYPSVEGGAFRLLTYEAKGGEQAVEKAGAQAKTTKPQAVQLQSKTQSSEEQSQDKIVAFTRSCFSELLREAEQKRETDRLKQAQRASESDQSQDKEPPLAE